jgi:glucosamine-6-phosphate deaminase
MDHHGLVAEALVARVRDALTSRDHPVIGLATGRTPLLAYATLASFSGNFPGIERATFVMLDEYLGLPAHSPDRFSSVLRQHVLGPLGVDDSRFIALDPQAEDIAQECQRFESRLVDLGGVDLQILGIGTNGHIGFNEPGAAFDSRTRVVRLADSTVADNRSTLVSTGEVPRYAVTQGIGTILDAREIVLAATGTAKADIIAQLVDGASDPRVPACALRLHDNTTVLVDLEAAERLLSTPKRTRQPVRT